METKADIELERNQYLENSSRKVCKRHRTCATRFRYDLRNSIHIPRLWGFTTGLRIEETSLPYKLCCAYLQELTPSNQELEQRIRTEIEESAVQQRQSDYEAMAVVWNQKVLYLMFSCE